MFIYSLRMFAVGLILFLPAYSLYYAQRSPYFEIREIRYVGTRHIEPPELTQMLRNAFPRNILLFDLDRARDLLETEPWIRKVRLRRKLPGQIWIYIEERQPAAVADVDGELYLVDPEGVLLDQYGSRYQNIDKPIVKGLKNIARENAREENAARMALFQNVIQELDFNQKAHSAAISEIDVNDSNRIAVIPAQYPVPVYLGNNKFQERYEVFLANRELYSQLRQEYGVIESVDVGFDNRIIFHTPKQGKKILMSEQDSKDGKKEVALSRN